MIFFAMLFGLLCAALLGIIVDRNATGPIIKDWEISPRNKLIFAENRWHFITDTVQYTFLPHSYACNTEAIKLNKLTGKTEKMCVTSLDKIKKYFQVYGN